MAPLYGLAAAITLCPGVRVVRVALRPHRRTDASYSSRLRQRTSVPLCVPSSLHSAAAQLRSLSPATLLTLLLLPPLPRPPALDTPSPKPRRPNPVQNTAPACEPQPPEHVPVIICAGACPRESPSCATPPTPPPPRPAIPLRLHVHVNVDLDLVALARSLASRFDLPLPFCSLKCVLVRSFPKECRAF